MYAQNQSGSGGSGGIRSSQQQLADLQKAFQYVPTNFSGLQNLLGFSGSAGTFITSGNTTGTPFPFTSSQNPSQYPFIPPSLTTTVSEAMKGIPKGFVAGPIVAYRKWLLDEKGYLRSVGVSAVWPPGNPIIAGCLQNLQVVGGHHKVPARGCQCGVWGIKTVQRLNELTKPTGMEIYGRVALWGRVIEHVDGYRAEYGYPLLVFPPSLLVNIPGFPVPIHLAKQVGMIGEMYGCSVCVDWKSWEVLNDQQRYFEATKTMADTDLSGGS